MASAPDPNAGATSPSDPWSDLVLTLPMFIGYHLGVIFLPIRNAADVVTRELVSLAGHDRAAYGGLTLAIGLAYVLVLGLAGRGHALRW
ncbi:MAG TPA: CPBP family intramembrane glutamate endopeptidase, partial [Polyangiaceae bacterium]|nr:CPBP family intramembrane glutamate endopeptidase [Polyangiaceae bacterium]